MFDLVPLNRREMNLFREMDSLFNDPFFKRLATNDTSFCVDVEDKGDHFLLEAELPGFNKEDIELSVDGDCLTILARKEESKEEEKKNYVHRERRIGSYTRKFDISNIRSEDINGEFKNGVLKLTMPKLETLKPVQRKIEIEG